HPYSPICISGLVNAGKREKSERRAGERRAKRMAERGKRRAECRPKKHREDQEKSKDRISRSDGCKWWLVEIRERHLLWVEKCGKLSSLESKQPSESLLGMG